MLYDQREAEQLVLEHVIIRSRLHHHHRGFFADGARDDDEGNVQAALLQDRQSPKGIELRQIVVRKDYVKGLLSQSCLHPSGGFHHCTVDSVARSFQRSDLKRRVACRILDHQYPE